MVAPSVVVLAPARKGSRAVGVGEEDRAVASLDLQGPVESHTLPFLTPVNGLHSRTSSGTARAMTPMAKPMFRMWLVINTSSPQTKSAGRSRR